MNDVILAPKAYSTLSLTSTNGAHVFVIQDIDLMVHRLDKHVIFTINPIFGLYLWKTGHYGI